MNVIKRNGSEAVFDLSKIEVAVGKANVTVPQPERMTDAQIKDIASSVYDRCRELDHAAGVEDIQDMVEMAIMTLGFYEIAKYFLAMCYMMKGDYKKAEEILLEKDLKHEQEKEKKKKII